MNGPARQGPCTRILGASNRNRLKLIQSSGSVLKVIWVLTEWVGESRASPRGGQEPRGSWRSGADNSVYSAWLPANCSWGPCVTCARLKFQKSLSNLLCSNHMSILRLGEAESGLSKTFHGREKAPGFIPRYDCIHGEETVPWNWTRGPSQPGLSERAFSCSVKNTGLGVRRPKYNPGFVTTSLHDLRQVTTFILLFPLL